jgi:hypothetical protein
LLQIVNAIFDHGSVPDISNADFASSNTSWHSFLLSAFSLYVSSTGKAGFKGDDNTGQTLVTNQQYAPES